MREKNRQDARETKGEIPVDLAPLFSWRSWCPGGALALGAAVVAWCGAALAHDVDREGASDRAAARRAGGESAVDDSRPEEPRAEMDPKKFSMGLDLVLGWGKVPFAVQNLPRTLAQAITYTRSDDTPSHVQSFVLGLGWEASTLALAARLPFSFGTFSPGGSDARSSTSFGNVEFEGEYPLRFGEHLVLASALGVALPTGQGQEIPAQVGPGAKSAEVDEYDRFSLARAAAYARGYEDNALFEPKRLGFVPKVSLSYRANALTVEPYVKVENLVATSTALENKYVGELVPALRLGYRLGRVELGLRGWANVGFAGGPEDKRSSGAVEPDVALVAGRLRAYGAVIVPVAGPPADAGFVAVRLGVSAAF
jgi:hypothetical protein